MCLLHIIDFESRFADHGQVEFSASSFDHPFQIPFLNRKKLQVLFQLVRFNGEQIVWNDFSRTM